MHQFGDRDEVYNPDSSDKGICEVICTKQRQGEIGITGLAFIGDQTRFPELSHGREFGRKQEPEKSRGYD